MAKYFKNPFGVDGDRASIPEATPPDGSVSYEDGFGVNYELEQGVDPDALDIPRAQFNQMMYDTQVAIQQYQQFGFPDFITSADNGGSPFSYSANATVRYGGLNYYSLVDANEDTPPSAKWGLVVYSQGVASGTVEPWLFNTIKAGYVWLNGTTIGNAASGASQRANADTATIFGMIWADYTNTICPIFDSAGAPSTRGVSAAADFAANKRLSLPDYCGRGMFFMDNMGGIAAKNRITTAGSGISGVTLGASGGLETVQLTGNQNGTHTHTGNTNSAGNHTHFTFLNQIPNIGFPKNDLSSINSPVYKQSVNEPAVAVSMQPGGGSDLPTIGLTNNAGAHTHSITMNNSGLGEAHQNMPPAVMAGGLIMKL